MTVYREKTTKTWIYDFWSNGVRFKRRCQNDDGTKVTSKRQAQAIENAARTVARAEAKLAATAATKYTLAQAIAARAEDACHSRNWRDISTMLTEIVKYFGPSTAINDVARRWAEFRSHSRKQVVRKWRGGPINSAQIEGKKPNLMRSLNRARSPARTNRYLDQLSAVLRLAHNTLGPNGKPYLEWMPKIEKLPEAKRNPNPVPLAVLARIESDPRTPDHLWQAAALVRLFGLRLAEVFEARVSWIDWEAAVLRLPASVTKANRDETLQANEEAVELLEWLALFASERTHARGHLIVYTPAGRNKDGQPYPARPIKNARRAWATALRRIGTPGRWRFHDLRATFITQVAMVAKSATTQSLARHKSPATTALYTEVADSAKRAAVAAMRSTAHVPTGPMFTIESPTRQSHQVEQSRTVRSNKIRRIK